MTFSPTADLLKKYRTSLVGTLGKAMVLGLLTFILLPQSTWAGLLLPETLSRLKLSWDLAGWDAGARLGKEGLDRERATAVQ